jgi:hypothetical protein
VSAALVLTRVLGAPLERVWNSWADPSQLARWWGGPGCGLPVPTVEDYAPLERLVCVLRFAGKNGGASVRSEVDFKDLGDGRTRVTVTLRIASVAARQSAHMG